MPTKDNFAHFFIIKTLLFIVKLRHFIELFFTFFCHLIHLGRIWRYVYIHISPTNKTDMQLKKYITFLASALLLFACAKEEFDTPTSTPDGPVTVGFWVGRGDTRTEIPNAGFEMDAPLGAETTRTHASSFDNSIGNGKLSVSWSNGDQVAMWAKPQNGTDYTFSNQTFKNWFVSADGQNAYFTTKLGNAMAEGTYNYYVCYPTPTEGTTNTFTIPSTQDGKMGGGADIMMAQGSGIALQSLDSNNDFVIDKPEGYPSFTMKHLIHSLMFHVPAGNNWGFPANETIERIVFTMPSTAVATGTVTADVTAAVPALSTPTNGSNTIALNLTDPIGPSSGNDLDFAAASIMPGTYNGNLTIKVYSQTKASQVTFSDINRDMAANRVTPVVLNCSNVVDQYYLRFHYGGNNLGEPVTAVRVKYKDENNIAQTLDIDVNQFAKEGGFYDVDLTSWNTNTDFSALRTALSNQTIIIEYESVHAKVSNTAKLPDTTRPGVNDVTLTVPYLFEQNFDNIAAFSDGHDNIDLGLDSDKYNSSISLKDYGLSEWSGVRVGANGSIRICCRYESGLNKAAYYKGRLDTAPIGGLTKTANIRIMFEYGGGATDNNAPLMYFGYTQNSGNNNAGGNDTGTVIKVPGQTAKIDNKLIDGVSIETGATFDGEFSKYNNGNGIIINNATSGTRLTWAVSTNRPASLAGNGNYWLYLDNIKVQIVSE